LNTIVFAVFSDSAPLVQGCSVLDVTEDFEDEVGAQDLQQRWGADSGQKGNAS
jgi:hypothetical protein